MQMCPPCVPPPSPYCVGGGPCGCGPYTCPEEECGNVTCMPPQVCCNPLMSICTLPDEICLQ